jgi:hypothetical protein
MSRVPVGQKWTMSESQLQEAIIELAHLQGWRVMHARKQQGIDKRWRTAYGGDGVGWPDLCLVSGDRRGIMWVECKSDIGKLTSEQAAWISAIQESGGSAFVWRPADWYAGRIEAVLMDEAQRGGA